MEWSRIKSILICIFVAINLLLAKVYISTNNSQITIDDATIENTVTVLNTKNIHIDKDIIAKTSSDVMLFNVTNKCKTTKDFSDSMYTSAKNNGIDYFNPATTEYNGETVIYRGTAKDHSEVHKNLKKIGIFDGYKFKRSVLKSPDKTTLTYNIYINGVCILDSYLKAETENESLTLTLSNFPGDIYSETGYFTVQTMPEGLVSFSNAVKFEKPFNISSVEQGYLVGDRNGELRTTNATPVWKISGENGEKYYIDMRNGDFLDI